MPKGVAVICFEMKVVVYDAFAASPGDLSWDGWDQLGDVTIYDRTAPEDVVERGRGAEVVITNKVVIDRNVIGQLPQLRYIGVLATGFNVVDTVAAREHGIVVTNIPAYSTMSVTQMVFAHLLDIANNVGGHSASVHGGLWQRADDFSYMLTTQMELDGKTMGIVGLGKIGMQVAKVAMAFGMKVLAYTSKDAASLPPGIVKAQSMDDVFSMADVVTLHCPLTESTVHLVNDRTLGLMKSSAILINTGRGGLVDEDALARALRGKRIMAAGVDVLTEEPPRHGSPLIGIGNCHITPHIAWATLEARMRLMRIALDNVIAFVSGKPQKVVN